MSEENRKEAVPPQWAGPLQSAMKAYRLTQDDLAKLVGVSRGAIGHHFTGRRTPDRDQVRAFLAICDLDELPAFLGHSIEYSNVTRAYVMSLSNTGISLTRDDWEKESAYVGMVKSIQAEIEQRVSVIIKAKDLGIATERHQALFDHLTATARLVELEKDRILEKIDLYEEDIKDVSAGKPGLAEGLRNAIQSTGKDLYQGSWIPFRVGENRALPVISSVQAGGWGEAADPFEPGDAEDWEVVPGAFGASAFILRVEGDSMTSSTGGLSIPNGSKVAVDPEAQATNGSIVVAKLDETDRATLKKLVLDPPYSYLMPLNEKYDKIPITEGCRIVGVVKKVIQDL